MNTSSNADAKRRELADLRRRVAELEAELGTSRVVNWPPAGFYADYYAYSGAVLGGIAALVSLLANVIGAPLAGKGSLELIRVYLTFPLGEKALGLSADAGALTLTLGCCLYVFTGMFLGVPMFWLMVRICGSAAPLGTRLLATSLLAIALWLINFYAVLSWLQPALFGGDWITDPAFLPPWVAVGTHLIFGWVIALLSPWGQFRPYQQPTQAS